LGERLVYGLKVLSNYPKIPKNTQTFEGKNSKKRDLVKVEEGSVHCNKYNGYCMTQWVIIPKAT
jgi:hypothetical protein